MKMKKRFSSILLSLVMMLGLMPGMSLMAYADGHTHDFEYTASGDTITAICKNEDCTLEDNKVTLTIKAPENLYYNDTTASHAATLENLEAFNAATGKGFTQDSITYFKGSNQSQDIKKGTPKAATYTAKIAADGNLFGSKVASVTFTFTAKPVEHTHSFTYTANGAVITATCTSTTGNCDLTNKQATLTLNAPLHTTYGDGKAANATFTGEIPGVTNPDINYRRSDTPLGSAPEDAGTYTAWCQLGNATASVEYTIGKATNNGWTTLPQAINNLGYTGQPQALITAGTASGGSALYTVGTDPNNEPDDTAGGRPYTSSVPEMTNAGTYYVWCKIDGGKNYTSIDAQKIAVVIAKANISPSVSIVGWTYGQTANTPMVGDTDNPGNGEVTYTYKVKDADDSTYKSTVPTAPGNYTVKAVIAETANYNSGVATKDFTISKATLTVTAKDQNISVGDEVPDLSDPVLDTHYTVAGLVGTDTLTTAPTLAYQKDGNAATPDNTVLGTYDIVASGASAGDNYTISYTKGLLTINKANSVAASVTANNITYDGTEKHLVTVDDSTLVGGEMQYALGGDGTTAPTEGWEKSIPTATNAGTYYVWYKVKGDANHNDTEPKPVNVLVKDAYYVYEGNDQIWQKGSSNNVKVTFKGKYNDREGSSKSDSKTFENWLKTVTVDGKTIDKSSYNATEGSLIVELKSSYLETLSVGGHRLSVSFEEETNTVNANFTVKEKPSSGGGSSSPKKDNVVTCQMAGYPSNYAWNEAAKACQAGYLDAGGNFHPYNTVRRSNVPNTSDNGNLTFYVITMVLMTFIAYITAKTLAEDSRG